MSQQINLFEARLRPRHELATARNLAICAVLIVATVAALAVWTRGDAQQKTQAAEALQVQVVEAQARLTEAATAVAQRRVTPALANEIDVAKMMLGARREVMAVLESGPLGNATGFSGVMTGFAHLAQNDLWLTGFALNDGGENIEVRGRLLNPAKLPPYLQRLSEEPVFAGRRFAALEMRDVRPEAIVVEANAPPPLEAPQSLPAFTEFVLRSEKTATASLTASPTSGANP